MDGKVSRRRFLGAGLSGLGLGLSLGSWAPWPSRPALADAGPASHAAALTAARGQEVYFNAWGGDQRINDYIAWAAGEIKQRFGVTLHHVKLADTAEAVSRIIAEKAAGEAGAGSVDLIWINGENFATLKNNDLLFGPILKFLPNMRFVDLVAKPTMLVDFTVPTEGFEAPWGMAQLVFFHDSARIAAPPRSPAALLDWAAKNPGRFTYPAPPDFIGTAFLKEMLLLLSPDRAPFGKPAGAAAEVDALTAPLWDYLAKLNPHLWRGGESYPAGSSALRQLMGDGEIDIYMAFNPGDASSAIAQGQLHDSVRGFVMTGGSIANTHFLAIPFNARAKAGALVAVDFLLSPEAQARKQNADIWGDPTVLEMRLLAAEDQARFASLPQGMATLKPTELGPVLPEPHPSWVAALEERWIGRFGH